MPEPSNPKSDPAVEPAAEKLTEEHTKRSIRLSIRLLKPGIEPRAAFHEKARERVLGGGQNPAAETAAPIGDGADELQPLYEYPWGDDGSVLYVGTAYVTTSSWIDFLRSIVPTIPRLRVQATAGVLFVPIHDEWTADDALRNRWLAVMFGVAHLFMDSASFVRSFGMRVGVNLVDPEQIKSVDLAQPNRITVQRRVQASKPTDRRILGVDVERDMLRSIAGRTRNVAFAKSVNGANTLSFATQLSADEITNKCREALRLYHSTDYRQHFEWVDRLQTVISDNLQRQLDQLLHIALDDARTTRDVGELALAPPEIIDYRDSGGYVFAGFRSRNEYDELDIANYVAELAELDGMPSLADIQTKHRIGQRKDGRTETLWPVYDCLVFTAEINRVTYILWFGDWYEVAASFLTELDEFIDTLPTDAGLPDAIGRGAVNEQIYNGEIVPVERPEWVSVDTNEVTVPGWRTSIEPCDFFTPDRKFIHIKNGTKSSSLSHLFNQGVVSADAITNEREFRRRLRRGIRNLCREQRKGEIWKNLPPPGKQPRIDEFTVVYGILREDPWTGFAQLPIFSKITLRNSVRELQKLGFRVVLHRIRKDRVA